MKELEPLERGTLAEPPGYATMTERVKLLGMFDKI